MNSPQKQITFQSRKAIVPEPPTTRREGVFSRVARLFQSRRPKAEPARGTAQIQSRDLLELRRSWEAGKEANRVLERRLSVYFSDLPKAQRMDLVLWMNDFKRLMDISKGSDSSADAPALMQKIRIISRAEAAILAFSARCAVKAAIFRPGSAENLTKEAAGLIKLKEFLEQVSDYLEGSALNKVLQDTAAISGKISFLQRPQASGSAAPVQETPEQAPSAVG
ncbi:hypothetical protein JW721_01845 [Candidatus Micrarchaeota archaeon]|nr:hypothetical protein [Candidatus Micrarchaeota archaeon]